MKMILMQCIQQMELLNLMGIFVSFTFCWFVLLQLGYCFLGKSITFRTILICSLIGAIFGFLGRIFLSNELYLLLYYTLYVLILMVTTKRHIINHLFSMFFVFFLTELSVYLFGRTIILAYPSAKDFLFSTAPGAMVGAVIESILPIMVIFICNTFRIVMFPRVNKLTSLNLWSLILFVSLILSFCNTMNLTLLAINQGNDPLRDQLFFQLFNIFAALASVIIIRVLLRQQEINYIINTKNERNLLRSEYQKKLEQSYYHINDSTNNLFRNSLLFVCELLSHNKRDAVAAGLRDHLLDIVNSVPPFHNFNPICYFLLISKRIAAIQSGIMISLDTNTGLEEYKDLRFWSVFSKLLDIIIKAHITLDHEEQSLFRRVVYISRKVIHVTLEDSPTNIVLKISTIRTPNVSLSNTSFLEQYLDPADREILPFLKNHTFSYGVYGRLLVDAQLCYNKAVQTEKEENAS